MARLGHMSQPQPCLLKPAESSGSKPNKELLPWAEMSSARHKPSGWDLGTSIQAQQHRELQQGGRSCLLPVQWGRFWGDGPESLLLGVEGKLLWSKLPIKPRKNKMSLQSPVGWEAKSSISA